MPLSRITVLIVALTALCAVLPAAAVEQTDLAGYPTAHEPGTTLGPGAAVTDAGALALRGPVDDRQYVTGPGDRLSIVLWGKSTVTHTATITPEGELILPGVAPISVGGMALFEAKREIIRTFGEIYRNVEISVSLSGLRTVRISVLGNVVAPGEYTGTALDLAGEMIERAGGLGEGASTRNISIRRTDGEEALVDLIRYRNAGDMLANPPILDGDVVFVPQAVSYVHINGAVAWPGSYELGPDDTLASLLEIAGGFARGAVRDTVFLHRFVDSKTTRAVAVDMADAPSLGLSLADGDQVYVRSEHEWREARSVLVEGEVLHPGPYGINEGADRLSDILSRAGGPTDRASLRDARIVRSVIEDDPDREFKRLGSLAVDEMAETELAYWKSRMRDEPGSVIADFGRALSGDVTHDVLLLNGDTIIVPRMSHTVKVGGHVANPGRVPYVPGERYSFYVKSAGGFESGARTNAIKVIRSASGEWVPAGRAGSLEPGDEVWVPERREGAFWRMLREVAVFAASIATAYLLIDQATK